MDERGYGGDNHKHDRGERIDAQFPVKGKRTGLDPGHDRFDICFLAAGQEAYEDRPAQKAGGKQAGGRDRLGRNRTDKTLAKTRDQRCQERQENDDMYRSHWMFTPSSG